MKKTRLKTGALAGMLLFTVPGLAQVTPRSQMEKLTRGVVALPASKTQGNFVSWRLLGTDPDNTTFDVLRDGKRVGTDLSKATCLNDASGTSTSKYQIVTKRAGVAIDTTEAITPWGDLYKSVAIDRPEGGEVKDGKYTYVPGDCSVGDVDGDGEYELILHWCPTDSRDNGAGGFSGPEIFDCYELDGTKLWRINLGINIRAGAHYTQFMVYDFDGDGKAEMICKTAPGSIDGTGHYVTEATGDESIRSTDNTKSYVNSNGMIATGPEYLTVFSGQTGEAINTIYYNPNRGFGVGGSGVYNSAWGDTWYNRGDRFLACVAYLDGPDKRPSAVMCRGYYTRSYLWAVDFNGMTLSTKWLHASISHTEVDVTNGAGKTTKTTYSSNTSHTGQSFTAYGQGAHSIAVGDVDGDGCDEIVYGAACIDNDGSLLYSTGFGHGDAQHLADMDPDRPGLEYFMIQEEGKGGYDVYDARTGEILKHEYGNGDTSRGMAADIDDDYRGYEYWSYARPGVLNIKSDSIAASMPSVDFRIYWDGDLQDELYTAIGGHNSPYLEKWNGGGAYRMAHYMHGVGEKNWLFNINSTKDCNGTKSTPNISADLFGDWREEMVLWCGKDSTHLNIFTTNVPTNYRIPTLMHDHLYRMGIAWQNVAYNQPPHIGYYLPDAVLTRFNLANNSSMTQNIDLGDSIKEIECDFVHCSNTYVSNSILPDGTKLSSNKLPAGFSFNNSGVDKKWVLKGKPEAVGDYSIIICSVGDLSNKSIKDTVRISVFESTGIQDATTNKWVALQNYVIDDQIHLGFNLPRKENVDVSVYDMSGKVIYKETLNIDAKMNLSISGFRHIANGMYIVNVRSAEGRCSMKAIKK